MPCTVKALRLEGPLEDDSPRLGRLFELGCVGMVEVAGETGPEVLAYFERVVPVPLEGRWEAVEDVDYVAAYRRGLKPVRVGPVVVAPTHRRVVLRTGEQVVWLDPAGAFGTGHHETTRLALAALGRLDLMGRSVLDVGSGSGVLAIAADRLGAALALGVDIDVTTLGVARANARLNRSRARFLEGSLEHADLPERCDVIVANLHAELHVSLMAAYRQRLRPGGSLLLSGILARLTDAVVRALPSDFTWELAREGVWTLVHATLDTDADRDIP